MKRREFITLLGGAAATWPLAAKAQQPEPTRRIGVLMLYPENDPEGQRRATAFRDGLQNSAGSSAAMFRPISNGALRPQAEIFEMRSHTNTSGAGGLPPDSTDLKQDNPNGNEGARHQNGLV